MEGLSYEEFDSGIVVKRVMFEDKRVMLFITDCDKFGSLYEVGGREGVRQLLGDTERSKLHYPILLALEQKLNRNPSERSNTMLVSIAVRESSKLTQLLKDLPRLSW